MGFKQCSNNVKVHLIRSFNDDKRALNIAEIHTLLKMHQTILRARFSSSSNNNTMKQNLLYLNELLYTIHIPIIDLDMIKIGSRHWETNIALKLF